MNGSEILKFLTALKANNNREWFEENKPWYRECHAQFTDMTAELIGHLSHFEESIALLDPRKCIYRIYRDIRFSRDKTPYKTNFGAEISPGGRKSPFAGYYFQVSPDGSFTGGGMYRPQPEVLQKVRQEIDYNGTELKKILTIREFKKFYPGLWTGDTLKRAPKGYDEDNQFIAWIRLKSFVVMHEIPASQVRKDSFIPGIKEAFTALHPFNQFLNTALS